MKFIPINWIEHFRMKLINQTIPDSKVHGANMGPIWGRQDPGGHHVGPMNFAIWDFTLCEQESFSFWAA